MPVETVLLDNAITQLRAALMRVVERKDAAGGYPFQDAIDIPAAAGDEALKILAEAGYAMFQLLFRSEEHTSELQSLMRISYAVFCLKKKKCRRTGNEQVVKRDVHNEQYT